MCVADTEVKGTKIPKDMYVIIPVHALSNDPDVWPNPEQFDPERYSVKECLSLYLTPLYICVLEVEVVGYVCMLTKTGHDIYT